ncbi:bifunctional DNA-formamidopyrimidine glycosylase/DNA-(apurinic or apyrimidinic site) lyase [Candidatus Saccharibacteria bacterium]|nr:bifunctional DNA-formamidopyrimidine glycosylase/DNA-(apurinic or apyrimidinic site) lyase [Candidatus Saccharibacteria bacterium]
MPELPEVETVRRGLERLIIGRIILGAKVHDSPRSFPNSDHDVRQFFHNVVVTSVGRRAKVLLIGLSSEYTLVTHLKMTGQLVYVGNARFGAGHPNDSLIGTLPDKSTRVTIEFADGSHLYFNDQRKFGWMKLYPTLEVPNIDFMQKVGPEPLEDSFTAAEFIPRVRRRNNTTIKAAILDQTVLAGVGNIYADESLWAAKIHPALRVRDISDAQLATLIDEIKYALKMAIEKGGSTDRNYVNAEGKKGSYIEFARVFRREGLECPRCGATIEKSKVAGRGTHTCPSCQVQ